MGVAARGATLEIQLVADVARLKRDMADMQAAVERSTGGATRALSGMGTGAAATATQMAAAAQASARAATGFHSTGLAASNARIAMLEATHIAKNLGEQLAAGVSPMRALTMESGRFLTLIQYGGGIITGMIGKLGQYAGLVTIVKDAELAEAAANAATNAQAVEAIAARAARTLVARQAQVALAEAEVAGAASSEAAAAAQSKLEKALRATFLASGKAATANEALAVANAEAAASAEASAAATATTMTPLGMATIAIVGVAAALGVAYAAYKLFIQKTDETADAVQKEVEKLEKNAATARIGAAAHDAFARTIEGSIAQVDDLTKALDKQNLTLEQNIAKMRESIQLAITNTAANVRAAATQQLAMIARLRADQAQVEHPGPFSTGQEQIGAIAQRDADLQQVKDLKTVVDALTGSLGKAKVDLRSVDFSLLERTAKEAANPLQGINRIYDDQIIKAEQAAAANDDLKKSLGATLKEIEIHRKADLDAEREREKKPKHPSDHGLAEALALTDAAVEGQYRLADAYRESDVAAMKAEALQKAEEQAIRHKSEVGKFYEIELAKAAASRAAEGGKQIADLVAETGARARVNDAVEQGLIPASRANEALQLEQRLRPLVAAAAVAEGEHKQHLKDIIADLKQVDAGRNDEVARGIALQQMAKNDDDLAGLRLEATLLGASNRERAVRLAQLKAEQDIKNNGITDPKQIAQLMAQASALANAQTGLAEGQNAYNIQLTETQDHLKLIAEQTQALGQIMSDAFGSAGDAIGGVLSGLADWQAKEQEIADWKALSLKDLTAGTKAYADIEAQAANKSATAQMEAISGVLGGLKGLFKQHSAGYKAMEAAEKAYAIVQAISTIKSVAAGAAKMFAQLGVWAFPAVAAMIAVMAGLGFSGGHSSAKPPASAEDLQKAAGTGTVLGDSAAKSASIANALELVAKNSAKGVDYSADMVRSLRNIESGIGNLTAAIAKQLQLEGGFFDTTGKVGTSSSGIQGLFGSTTTKSLYDQGIILNAATVAQIMDAGITGATYQVIEKIKKNSGFLGIGGSTKTSYDTTNGALDGGISHQIDLVIGNLYTSVVQAAKVLGLDVAAALKTFQVEIGKISFKDLTGQQITDELNAVFSKVGDQMAGFAVAGLANFQKAGEGLFETLMRLAKDYLTIDSALKSIGMTFGSVGAGSVAARESLIDLAGGLDQFVSQVNFFYDHFLTDAQKTAFAQAQVDAAFQAMGAAVPSSVAGFTALVQGLDLSTDAGQQMFEALMQVAPAFYDVATAAQQLAQKQQELQVQLLQAQGNTAAATELQRQMALAALDPSLVDLQKQVWAAQDAAAAAAAATELQNKQTQIQIELLNAQGKTEQALALQRQMELAALDPALRALQQQLYRAQDIAAAKDRLSQAYARESQALQQTADTFHKFADDLKAFRDSLYTTGDSALSYNQALIGLLKQSGLANAGDQNALGGGLQSASQTFLDIATQNARSLQDVERARAMVARTLDQAIGGANGQASLAEQQLAAMKTEVGALVDINDSVLSVHDAIVQLQKLMFPAAASAPVTGGASGSGSGVSGRFGGLPELAGRDVGVILEEIRDIVTSGTFAQNKVARILDRADRGGSLAIATDSDTPLQTQVVA